MKSNNDSNAKIVENPLFYNINSKLSSKNGLQEILMYLKTLGYLQPFNLCILGMT